MTRHHLLRVLAAVLAAMSSACGGSSTGVAGTSTATFTLVTVNGKPLPFTLDSIPFGGSALVTHLLAEQLATALSAGEPNQMLIGTASVERTDGGGAPTRIDTVRSTETVPISGQSFQLHNGATGSIGVRSLTLTASGTVYLFIRNH